MKYNIYNFCFYKKIENHEMQLSLQCNSNLLQSFLKIMNDTMYHAPRQIVIKTFRRQLLNFSLLTHIDTVKNLSPLL